MKSFVKLLLLMVAGLAATQSLFATPLCTTTTVSAAVTCQYDGLIFSNFSYTYADTSGNGLGGAGQSTNVTSSNVVISWETDSNGVLSVDFTTNDGGWAVVAGDSTDIDIGYNVATAVPSPVGLDTFYILGEGLQAQGTVSNNVPSGTGTRTDTLDKSSISIAETATPNAGSSVTPALSIITGQNNTLPNTFPTLTVSNAGNLPAQSCPAPSATPNADCLDSLTSSTGVRINKDVAISGGEDVTGGYDNSANLLEIWEPLYETSPAPEPIGLALTGCGLIGLGLMGRKIGKRKKN